MKKLNFKETEKATISVPENNDNEIERSLLMDDLGYLNDLNSDINRLADKETNPIRNSKFFLKR